MPVFTNVGAGKVAGTSSAFASKAFAERLRRLHTEPGPFRTAVGPGQG